MFGLAERWPLYATIAFMLVCFLIGGASRSDVVQNVFLRPLAIILAFAVLCFAPRIDWRAIRWPGGLLVALALLMVIQLLPLPYALWTALPGRGIARDALELTGLAGTAHALSLTPDRTLNSLFALSVPIATLLAMASLGPHERRIVLPWLVGAMLASILLGFLQLVRGRFYFYQITNLGSAVGFFANRNHQAALIAAALPLVACLATWPPSSQSTPRPDRRPAARPVLLLFAGGIMVLAVLAVLSIGSRWGLALAATGLVWATALLRHDLRRLLGRKLRPIRVAVVAAPLAMVAVLAAIAVFGSRDESLRRLSEVAISDDIRTQTLPITWAMLRGLFPLGSGFGSFEAMYRIAEPRDLLGFQYLNHVHNDYIELVIEAGMAGLVLLVAALGWYLARMVHSFRQHITFADGFDRRLAQAAAGVALIAVLASITDYPVRTPIWMMVLSICAVWLAGTTRSAVPKKDGSTLHEHASRPRGSTFPN